MVWRKASKMPPEKLNNLQNTFHYFNKVLIKVIKYKQLTIGANVNEINRNDSHTYKTDGLVRRV